MKKIASSNCLGVPRPKGEIVLIKDASDVGGGGTIYQWQELKPAELTHCHYRTSGLNCDGSLKHDYPTSEWRLVPLGHWNWKWNQARSNYSTYDQELLAGILVLSSQSRLSKPVRTPVAIFGSLGVCIYVPESRHWLISYSPIQLTSPDVIV